MTTMAIMTTMATTTRLRRRQGEKQQQQQHHHQYYLCWGGLPHHPVQPLLATFFMALPITLLVQESRNLTTSCCSHAILCKAQNSCSLTSVPKAHYPQESRECRDRKTNKRCIKNSMGCSCVRFCALDLTFCGP